MSESWEPASSSRKRGRSSPVNTGAPLTGRTKKSSTLAGPDANLLASQLQDPTTVNSALNTLLETTMSHEINYTLHNNTPLLKALVELIEYQNYPHSYSGKDDLDPSKAWRSLKKRPTLEYSPVLRCVLIILRNMSFVAANQRPIAHETRCLALLTDCLYLTDQTQIRLHALHTLINLTPVLDVTGQRLLSDTLFVNTARELGQMGWGGLFMARALGDGDFVNCDAQTLWDIVGNYVSQLWQLFPALKELIVSPKTPRSLLMATLEWMKELLEHHTAISELPNMETIMVSMPDDLVQRILDCLWIPRLGPDALEYVNPICNIVSRVPTLKLTMGYDATVDTEIRDRALEVVQVLTSYDKAPHIPATPRLYNALLPALTTKVGRNDAPSLANSILKALGKLHGEELLYLQPRILELASKDARLAQVTLGHVYK